MKALEQPPPGQRSNRINPTALELRICLSVTRCVYRFVENIALFKVLRPTVILVFAK